MSGFRRRLLAQAATKQYIEGYCNVYNSTYSFIVNYSIVSTTTDNNGYFKYYFAATSNLTRVQFASINNESNKLVSISFSKNFKFGNLDLTYMFGGGAYQYPCVNLTSISGFKVEAGNTSLQRTFMNCSSLTSIDTSGWITANVTNTQETFAYINCNIDIHNLDLSNVVNAYGMFLNFGGTTLNVSGVHFSSLQNAQGMFRKISATSLDVSAMGCESLENASEMFYLSSSIQQLDMSLWKTDNLQTMYYMFRLSCGNLIFGNDWNSANITDYTRAFDNNTRITSLSLGWLNIKKNDITTYMFGANLAQSKYLTSIVAIGTIEDSVSFEYNNLDLSSAKIVLSALQDLQGGTATLRFSSATSALIQADTNAMNLVAQAQSYGWTITFN